MIGCQALRVQSPKDEVFRVSILEKVIMALGGDPTVGYLDLSVEEVLLALGRYRTVGYLDPSARCLQHAC